MKKYCCKVCGETNPENFYKHNKSKCKFCISGKSKEDYNSHKSATRKLKSYLCLSCGETNPSLFYGSNKSYCKMCMSENKKTSYVDKKVNQKEKKPYNPHKTTVIIDENGNRVKIHKCFVCGETDPKKFNKSSKGRCKKCQEQYNNVRRKENYIPKKRALRMSKPYKCTVCGETNPNKFAKCSKSLCKICSNIKYHHGFNTKEEILKVIEDRKKPPEPKPYLCNCCGETNPLNFRKKNKSKCKARC